MQRHRGDHDDVAPGEQAVGGRVPQPLDLVVDRGVLLDVGVRLRDVRLGLVVVVVARRSTRPRCSGSSSRNSLASWAARVLFGAITSVGRCSRSTSQAVVADLPVPVAPSSTTSCSPAWIRAARARRSPSAGRRLGWKSLTTSNGATVRSRSVMGRIGLNRTTSDADSARTPGQEPARPAPPTAASTWPSRLGKVAVVVDHARRRPPAAARAWPGRPSGHGRPPPSCPGSRSAAAPGPRPGRRPRRRGRSAPAGPSPRAAARR